MPNMGGWVIRIKAQAAVGYFDSAPAGHLWRRFIAARESAKRGFLTRGDVQSPSGLIYAASLDKSADVLLHFPLACGQRRRSLR